jgi:hypothetical protein
MIEIGEQLIGKLRSALPGSTVYWEKEPTEVGLDGAVLSAEYQHRKFTMQFERAPEHTIDSPADSVTKDARGNASGQRYKPAGEGSANENEVSLLEEIVDDFTDFFSRTIYPKEKFTRII